MGGRHCGTIAMIANARVREHAIYLWQGGSHAQVDLSPLTLFDAILEKQSTEAPYRCQRVDECGNPLWCGDCPGCKQAYLEFLDEVQQLQDEAARYMARRFMPTRKMERDTDFEVSAAVARNTAERADEVLRQGS